MLKGTLKNVVTGIVLLAGIALSGCEKEEVQVEPIIELKDASEIAVNAAILRAEIIDKGARQLVSAGFIIKYGVPPGEADVTLDNSYEDRAIARDVRVEYEKGPVSGTIANYLGKTGSYYYRFYVQAIGGMYLSEIKTFKFVSPVVESISPESGTEGTLVTLMGQHFGSEASTTKVMVGNKQVAVEEVTNNRLTFRMPLTSGGNNEIKVLVGGVASANSLVFNFFHQFVFDLTTARSGDELVFEVSNGRLNNIYKINGVAAQQSWTWPLTKGIEVGVKVPQGLAAGEATVEVFDSQGVQLINKDNKVLTIIQ